MQTGNTLWKKLLWDNMGAKKLNYFKKNWTNMWMRNPPRHVKYKGATYDSEITWTIHWMLNNFFGEIWLHDCSCNSFISQNLCLFTIICCDRWIFWFHQRLLFPCVCPAANAQELGQLQVFIQWVSTENCHSLSLPSGWSFCPNLIDCNFFLR